MNSIEQKKGTEENYILHNTGLGCLYDARLGAVIERGTDIAVLVPEKHYPRTRSNDTINIILIKLELQHAICRISDKLARVPRSALCMQ